MEFNEPNLLEEDLDITGGVIVDNLTDVFNGHSLPLLLTFILTGASNDGVDEFSEVFTNWEVDEDVLEQINEVFAGK